MLEGVGLAELGCAGEKCGNSLGIDSSVAQSPGTYMPPVRCSSAVPVDTGRALSSMQALAMPPRPMVLQRRTDTSAGARRARLAPLFNPFSLCFNIFVELAHTHLGKWKKWRAI